MFETVSKIRTSYDVFAHESEKLVCPHARRKNKYCEFKSTLNKYNLNTFFIRVALRRVPDFGKCNSIINRTQALIILRVLNIFF